MSKKAEIIAILRKHATLLYPTISIPDRNYIAVATEIEGLYEGKIKYLFQKLRKEDSMWCYIAEALDKDVVLSYMARAKEMSPEHKFRIIKRTTTDQIIEE